ncbi:hypothetical protein F0562_017933 [Nyssa sinensis]|uniref:BZIP domain-containing protein n=1 Tax=Nyssa sinensis TaxID=561372 RepID=A0A5J4ZAN2_9ASTE|nr:hypothetical protein F0562_017933 [Nyssa sinensis]
MSDFNFSNSSVDSGFLANEIMEQIDWDLNFDVDPSLLSDLPVDGSVNEFSNPSPLSIGEIEHLLMKDDDYDNRNIVVEQSKIPDNFLSDILLDSPVGSDQSGAVVDLSNGKNSFASEEVDVLPIKENKDGGGDPISKKRKRLFRNRVAAMRSRERKKMYVRDLEMKSRYLEGECKRLGMLLQCCFAENQGLRLSLQKSKAFDATMTKQESAVLLLESLLLGSLLWFLGFVCLLVLPRLFQSNVEVVIENLDKKNQGSLAPRRTRSKILGHQIFKSFVISKRCKASRSRMKPSSVTREVLVQLGHLSFYYFYCSF